MTIDPHGSLAVPQPRRPWPWRGLLAWGIALAVLLALGCWPWFVEQVYARTVSPVLCIALGRASGLLPFSLADLLLAGAPLLVLAAVGRAAWRVARRRAPATAPARAAAVVLHCALAATVVFYAVWGLNYARRPLAARLAWPAAGAPSNRAEQEAELAALCSAAVAAVNAAYAEAVGGADAGVPSGWPGTRAEQEGALDAGLAAAGTELGLDPWFAVPRGPSKRPLLSPLMSRLAISGFYFPLTGEANVNGETPGCDLLHVTAHEKAHQRGVAREDEAEFVGFIAGARAPHPYARYSAHLFACNALLRELGRHSAPRAAALSAGLLPGVQRDRSASAAFYQRHRGPLRTVAVAINHSYLRVQGDARGVRAYGAAANLLVRYARLRGRLD